MNPIDTQSSLRPVIRVVTATPTLEGAGFPVRRPFPSARLADADPFLLLDHLGPVDWAPGEALGAPDHPHRGFETVTYLLEGRMQHEDSTGRRGQLGPGDVQWMTAGAGVVHSEEPEAEFRRTGGRLEGFQVWVNLPRKDKRMAPRYQEIPRDRLPVAERDGVRVRVIAGEALGVRAVIDTRTPIHFLHFTLAPGASHAQPVPEDFSALAYVVRGEGRFGDGQGAREGQLAVFGEGGEAAFENTGEGDLDVLLLAGRPLREPVVRYGPFVMNTADEIREALADYQAGRLGAIER